MQFKECNYKSNPEKFLINDNGVYKKYIVEEINEGYKIKSPCLKELNENGYYEVQVTTENHKEIFNINNINVHYGLLDGEENNLLDGASISIDKIIDNGEYVELKITYTGTNHTMEVYHRLGYNQGKQTIKVYTEEVGDYIVYLDIKGLTIEEDSESTENLKEYWNNNFFIKLQDVNEETIQVFTKDDNKLRIIFQPRSGNSEIDPTMGYAEAATYFEATATGMAGGTAGFVIRYNRNDSKRTGGVSVNGGNAFLVPNAAGTAIENQTVGDWDYPWNAWFIGGEKLSLKAQNTFHLLYPIEVSDTRIVLCNLWNMEEIDGGAIYGDSYFTQFITIYPDKQTAGDWFYRFSNKDAMTDDHRVELNLKLSAFSNDAEYAYYNIADEEWKDPVDFSGGSYPSGADGADRILVRDNDGSDTGNKIGYVLWKINGNQAGDHRLSNTFYEKENAGDDTLNLNIYKETDGWDPSENSGAETVWAMVPDDGTLTTSQLQTILDNIRADWVNIQNSVPLTITSGIGAIYNSGLERMYGDVDVDGFNEALNTYPLKVDSTSRKVTFSLDGSSVTRVTPSYTLMQSWLRTAGPTDHIISYYPCYDDAANTTITALVGSNGTCQVNTTSITEDHLVGLLYTKGFRTADGAEGFYVPVGSLNSRTGSIEVKMAQTANNWESDAIDYHFIDTEISGTGRFRFYIVNTTHNIRFEYTDTNSDTHYGEIAYANWEELIFEQYLGVCPIIRLVWNGADTTKCLRMYINNQEVTWDNDQNITGWSDSYDVTFGTNMWFGADTGGDNATEVLWGGICLYDGIIAGTSTQPTIDGLNVLVPTVLKDGSALVQGTDVNVAYIGMGMWAIQELSNHTSNSNYEIGDTSGTTSIECRSTNGMLLNNGINRKLENYKPEYGFRT